jgi:hypothetical protein
VKGTTLRHISKIAIAGAAAALTFGALGVTAVAAQAAPTVGSIYTEYLGGFEASYAVTHLNEVRTNAFLPDLSGDTLVLPDTIASGVVLQAAPEIHGSVIDIPTLAVAWVWDDDTTASVTGCSSTQWTLEYDTNYEDSEGPIPPGDLTAVLNGSSGTHEGICANPLTTQYTEAHWSTSTNTLAVVASPFNGSESDQTTVALYPCAFYSTTTFLDAGIGVDASNGTDAGNVPLGTIFGYTRNGLTEPAGFNHGGKAGSRIPFDLFPTVDFEATTLGGAPSSGNLPTLVPSHLPAVSSDFTVTAGP